MKTNALAQMGMKSPQSRYLKFFVFAKRLKEALANA
jgi:hypothetical protein